MKSFISKVIQGIIIFFTLTYCHAQNALTHIPYVINFSKFDYSGGTENWKIMSTSRGYVYAANNEGLLMYDGRNWHKHTLPNKTIVRSFAVDTTDNKIYVGGQDEIGYFEKDQHGFWSFKSLKALMPKGFEAFEDVWDLQIGDHKVFFRTMYQVFCFDGNKIEKIPTSSYKINFIKWVDGHLIMGDALKGAFSYRNQSLTFIQGSGIFIGHRISDIISHRGKLIFLTEKNGIYYYDKNSFSPFLEDLNLKNLILTSIVPLPDKQFAVSSVLGGVLILDQKGQLVYAITKKQGLQNNNIISMALDTDRNLWLASANGIDQVLIHSPYQIMFPDGDLQGSVYDVKFFDEKLYVATNSGVYYTNWDPKAFPVRKSVFNKVTNTEGQAWALDIVFDQLFLCHNEGLFQIKNGTATKISNDQTGKWKCIPMQKDNCFLVGSYTGFQLYEKIQNTWKCYGNIPGFSESARIVAKDSKGAIWVSHPYRGVYKLTYDEEGKRFSQTKIYGKKDGLPSDLANYLTAYDESILINGETGIFQYNADKKKLETNAELTSIFGENVKTRRLFYDGKNRIWFVAENNSGIAEIRDWVTKKTFTSYLTPFLDGKFVGGFENVYTPYPEEAFVCTNKGVILMNLTRFFKKDSIRLRLNDVSVVKDDSLRSVFSDIQQSRDDDAKFEYENNTLHFTFGSNHLDPTTPLQYATFLKGLQEEWSPFGYSSEKTFHALKPGKYLFLVKARSGDGRESGELRFSFTIQNPWYRTKTAIFSYFLLLISMIWILIVYLEKKHEGEKSQLKQDYEKSEAKVGILLEEKLQADLDFKNKELALSTMHILQKNEVLTKIREELDHLIASTKETIIRSNIKKIISLLSDDQRLEDDWESFAFYFDQVHTDFLRRLKEYYPQLSNRDLRLCAYLRMNLTTKDIAPLLNISVRGVEISRYRLRKKMNIDTDINLNEFMMNY